MEHTTEEQSKKLIELGLDAETADLVFVYCPLAGTITNVHEIREDFKPEPNDIPCWSFSKLIELLPKRVNEYFLRIDFKYSSIGYYDEDTPLYPCLFIKESLMDAAVELFYWILEKKYYTKSIRDNDVFILI